MVWGLRLSCFGRTETKKNMKVNQLKRKKVASKGIEIITGKVISGRHFADSVAQNMLVGRKA